MFEAIADHLVAAGEGVRWRFLPIGWLEVKAFKEMHSTAVKRRVFFTAALRLKEALEEGRTELPTEPEDEAELGPAKSFPFDVAPAAHAVWGALCRSGEETVRVDLGTLGTMHVERKAVGSRPPRRVVVYRQGAEIAARLNGTPPA